MATCMETAATITREPPDSSTVIPGVARDGGNWVVEMFPGEGLKMVAVPAFAG